MKMPSEFRKLTRGFHQGVDEIASSLDELIEIAVSFVSPDEYAIIHTYLTEILALPLDKQRLQKVWDQSLADLYFHNDDDLVKVLQLLQARLTPIRDEAKE